MDTDNKIKQLYIDFDKSLTTELVAVFCLFEKTLLKIKNGVVKAICE
jgi:hypothetical protein